MSPSSALSSPKKAPEQLSLARAVTVENDPRLKQELAKDKIMKVDSINASAKLCRSESRNDMTDETISRGSAIAETDFTIMSMPSLVYAWFLFIMYLCSFIIASFPCVLQNCNNRH